MQDTQTAGAEAVENDAQSAQTNDNAETTQSQENSAENKEAPKSWVAPSEAEWKQYQKDQKDTQRRFNKRTAEMHQAFRDNESLKQRLEALEKGSKPQENARPDPNDAKWKTHDEYVEALADWKLDQREAKRNEEAGAKAGEDKKTNSERQWHEQRITHAEKQDAKYKEAIPDFDATYDAHADVFEAMPQHVIKALLGAEDGSIAAYQLMKEGRFESLINMPENFLVHEIVSAQYRGLEALKSAKPKATNAPAPLSAPNKGTSSGKSENEMSGRELRKKSGLI